MKVSLIQILIKVLQQRHLQATGDRAARVRVAAEKKTVTVSPPRDGMAYLIVMHFSFFMLILVSSHEGLIN